MDRKHGRFDSDGFYEALDATRQARISVIGSRLQLSPDVNNFHPN